MMKYKCLVLDHDDTVVNSTATIHYPCFIEYLQKFYPHLADNYTLNDYFVKNFSPGVIELFCDEIGMDEEELKAPLCSLLLERLGTSAHDALNSIYAQGKTYIASFAPIVFEAASREDEAARTIIEMNVEVVANRLNYVYSSLGDLDEVVCAGGLFNSPLFLELLSEQSKLRLSLLSVPPVIGACRRAMKLKT